MKVNFDIVCHIIAWLIESVLKAGYGAIQIRLVLTERESLCWFTVCVVDKHGVLEDPKIMRQL